MIDQITVFKAAAISFTISAVFAPLWIRLLTAVKMKQYIRDDIPQNHQAKMGVPTMGGFIFLFAFVSVSAVFLGFDLNGIFVLVSTFLFSAVGFIDDYNKMMKRQNEGLTIRGKFIFIILASVALWFLFLRSFELSLPFTDIRLHSPILTIAFIIFLYNAVTNATNITDGLDGLLASVTLVVSSFFVYVSFMRGNQALAVACAAFTAAIAGYLIFNWHPAKVMMGDFGSLAVGGYIVAVSLVLDIYWLIPIFGIWYVIEVASVAIQIIYFKKTGKRIFKMAPYHHHLEMSGMREVPIVFVALGFSVLGTIISIFLI